MTYFGMEHCLKEVNRTIKELVIELLAAICRKLPDEWPRNMREPGISQRLHRSNHNTKLRHEINGIQQQEDIPVIKS